MSIVSKLEDIIDGIYDEVEEECQSIADETIKNYDPTDIINEKIEEYFNTDLPKIVCEVARQINSEEFLDLFVAKIINNPVYLEKLCAAMFDKG